MHPVTARLAKKRKNGGSFGNETIRVIFMNNNRFKLMEENMYSVEFLTKPINGYIKLPKEFDDVNSELKVIIQSEVKYKKEMFRKSSFKAFSIKTKKFKFNRNQANER